MRAGLSARGSFRPWGHLGDLPRRWLCLAFLVLVAFFQHSESNEEPLRGPEGGLEWGFSPDALVSTHSPAEASSRRSFFSPQFDAFDVATPIVGIHTEAEGYALRQTNTGPQTPPDGAGSSSSGVEVLQPSPIGTFKEASPTRSKQHEDGEYEAFVPPVPRRLQDILSPWHPRSAASANQTTTTTRRSTVTRATTTPAPTTKSESTSTTTKPTTTLPPLQGWKEVEEGPLDAMKNEPDLTLLTKAMASNPLTQGDSIITRLAITLFAPTDEALSKLDVTMEELAEMKWMPRKEWVEEMIVMTHLVAPRLIDPREITTEESVFQTRSNQELRIYRAGPPDPKPPADENKDDSSKKGEDSEKDGQKASRSSPSRERPKARSGGGSREASSTGRGRSEGSSSDASSSRTGRSGGSSRGGGEEGGNDRASGPSPSRSPRRRTAQNEQKEEDDSEEETEEDEESAEADIESEGGGRRRDSGVSRKRRERDEEDQEEEEDDGAGDNLENQAEHKRRQRRRPRDKANDEDTDVDPTPEGDDDEEEEDEPRRKTSRNRQSRGRSSSSPARSTEEVDNDAIEEDEEDEDEDEEKEDRPSARKPQRQQGRSSRARAGAAEEEENDAEGDLAEEEFEEEEDEDNNEDRDSEEEEEVEEDKERSGGHDGEDEEEDEEEEEGEDDESEDEGEEDDHEEDDGATAGVNDIRGGRRKREEPRVPQADDDNSEAISEDEDGVSRLGEQRTQRRNRDLDSRAQPSRNHHTTATTTQRPVTSRVGSWRTTRQEDEASRASSEEASGRFPRGRITTPSSRRSQQTTVRAPLSDDEDEEEEGGIGGGSSADDDEEDEQRHADSQATEWRTLPPFRRSRSTTMTSRTSSSFITSGRQQRNRVRGDYLSRQNTEETAEDGAPGGNFQLRSPPLRQREASFEERPLQPNSRQGPRTSRRFGQQATDSVSEDSPLIERSGILSGVTWREPDEDDKEDTDEEGDVGSGMLRRRLSEEASSSSTSSPAPPPVNTSSTGSSPRSVTSFAPASEGNGTTKGIFQQSLYTQSAAPGVATSTTAAQDPSFRHTTSGSSRNRSTWWRISSSTPLTTAAAPSELASAAQSSAKPAGERHAKEANLGVTLTTTQTPDIQSRAIPTLSSSQRPRWRDGYPRGTVSTQGEEAVTMRPSLSNTSTAPTSVTHASRHTQKPQGLPAATQPTISSTSPQQATPHSSSSPAVAPDAGDCLRRRTRPFPHNCSSRIKGTSRRHTHPNWDSTREHYIDSLTT
ncbi:hypothetical protein, conserved [Eimeria praecox]|uniref:Transmembrane protein n=1 Tax=Eimeria praecox TaxID=51316 RepID=U6H0Z1_9EIME|nr:hypothetical protein, conserved [Eimeria praecox]